MLPSRILVVESEFHSRQEIATFLLELGYRRFAEGVERGLARDISLFREGQFETTADGQAAIQFVAQHDLRKTDLVLTSLFLNFRQTPMSGTNILVGVRDFYSPEIKVAVILPHPALRRDATGFDGVLEKPVTLGALRELFRRLFSEGECHEDTCD